VRERRRSPRQAADPGPCARPRQAGAHHRPYRQFADHGTALISATCCVRLGAQSALIWAPQPVIAKESPADQNGGDARRPDVLGQSRSVRPTGRPACPERICAACRWRCRGGRAVRNGQFCGRRHRCTSARPGFSRQA